MNEKCWNWKDFQGTAFEEAKLFLKDSQRYLKGKMTVKGYNTCNPLDSLDASSCAEDCKKNL